MLGLSCSYVTLVPVDRVKEYGGDHRQSADFGVFNFMASIDKVLLIQSSCNSTKPSEVYMLKFVQKFRVNVANPDQDPEPIGSSPQLFVHKLGYL